MSKRGSPALYELIRARNPERVLPPQQPGQAVDEPPDEPLPGSWLRPGRTLHVPIGYVFLTAAVMIVLIWASYSVGYSRAQVESRHMPADEAERLLALSARNGNASAGHAIPRDPLDRTATTTPSRPEFSPEPAAQGRSWGPIESDPRQAGMNYLILMTTDRAGAERFVNFARERGLETYMISSNNRRFRVFALPGFADTKSPQADRFREDVLRLGQQWMDRERTRVNPVGTSHWSRYG